MSLVVAIKDKNRFILGADKQASGWNNKSHSATKVWYAEYRNCCIGSVGFLRAAQVIQFIKGLLDGAGFGKDQLDEDFIHLQLPRTLYETLKMHGVIAEDPTKEFSLPNAFFIAYKDRCWQICQDLSVSEIYEYDAIGSGADVALGVIETSLLYHEKNPYRIIANAIDIAAEKTLFVDHEIDFVATEATKNDTINKAAAYGYDVSIIKQALDKNGKIDLEKLEALAAAADNITFNIVQPKSTSQVQNVATEEAQEKEPKKSKTKKSKDK